MANPFLDRIKRKAASVVGGAVNTAKGGAEGAAKEFAQWRPDRKVGTALGVTSLGLGVLNYKNNAHNAKANEQRTAIEQKSLTALNKIHTSLNRPDKKDEQGGA